MTRSIILLIIVLILQISQTFCQQTNPTQPAFYETNSLLPNIIDLKVVSLSQTSATISWLVERNEKITNYKITLQLKTLLGCKDFQMQPNVLFKPQVFNEDFIEDSKFTFLDLNPYTEYKVTVSPCNEKCDAEKSITIRTFPTYLPTVPITNFKFKYKQPNVILTWKKPKDCHKMTGPIRAATIVFQGISPAVKSFRIEKIATGFNFSVGPYIYGDEKYNVRVYPMRHPYAKYNSSNYLELDFRSPPKVPSKPKNLQVWQIDEENKLINLRWQSPAQPTNAKIDAYIMQISALDCDTYSAFAPKEKLPNEACSMWDNFICQSYKLNPMFSIGSIKSFQLVSFNKRTKSESDSICINFNGNAQIKEVSSPPINLKLFESTEGHNLYWEHPMKPNIPIEKFEIDITLLSTRLIEANITRNAQHLELEYFILDNSTTSKYIQAVDLLPASEYRISIWAVNKNGIKGQPLTQVERTIRASTFNGSIRSQIDHKLSTVVLSLPDIKEQTVDTLIHIIVLGPNPCEKHAEITPRLKLHARMNQSQSGWIAARFLAKDYASKTFTVGDNKEYDNATNCPLNLKEWYSIIVMFGSEQDPDGETMNFVVNFDPTSLKDAKSQKFNKLYWIIPTGVIGGIVFLIVIGISIHRCTRKPPEIPHKTLEEDPSKRTSNIYGTAPKNNLYTINPESKENVIYETINPKTFQSKQASKGIDEKPSPLQFTFHPPK